ncbi:MAG: S8 family peptidase [Candidatus Nealsonbacteria bacterium]|nr:S8 family peptidase [Candidatus Nealsonbacteria bacterium]
MAGIRGIDSNAAGNPQRVIITFEHAVNEEARAALSNLGGRVIKDLELVNGLAVLLPSEAAVKQARVLAGVKKVEEDAMVFAVAKPPWAGGGDSGQPAEVLEWGVDRIDADLAWASSRGFGVNVAIIDTGIDKDHADLVGNLKGGVNFVSKSPAKPADPNKWDDDNGHGTHVAGIVAAVDNEIGVIGTAPEAYLWAVKVLDRNGSGYISDVIDGINWAVNNGMRVVNMSLGTASDIQALHDAVDAAYNAGLVLVAAAGNSGDGNGTTNEVIYPAKYSSVIAVAATASDDSTPYWSSEGEEVELAAPGVDIRSTWNDGLYNTISGTSMATPHVAGTVALMLKDSVLSPAEVRAALQAAADDLGAPGRDNFYGYGLVDTEESVTGVQTQ